MDIVEIRALVEQMTLEEKAGLCSGSGFWHTKSIERLGIPSTMLSDGPHGLRKQEQGGDHLGMNKSIEAICFPTGCAIAASFDRDLAIRLGEALGNQCQAEDISVVLGPAVNIKRSPLCGRNFEYYSEDPLLTSEIAASFIQGVQSKNIGTSIKHYLANNHEHRRMTSSSEVDERTLREIYLAAFEGAIKKAAPWTVMASYNKINGTFATENKRYLTDILRGEWGFEGYVVSDWGGVNDRVFGLMAGLDLEMPSSRGYGEQLIINAVHDGILDEKVIDQTCERILNIVFQYAENRNTNAVWDKEADHELASVIAQECMVLLKNDDRILPLQEKTKVAFIGHYANTPRYQGGGSSHINSYKVTSALEASKGNTNVIYAQGYNDLTNEIDEVLKEEAIKIAKDVEVAVIFAGLPENFESEGYDREHMKIPLCQNDLIEAIASVQPNTIVVLHNGSPVEMPWVSKVKGILEVYLGGQAVGQATYNVLYGKANPCGRLPETFPVKLEDNPSYLYYKGENDVVEYREGIFVGYRYYETKKKNVLFPFGHGLTYTSFAYSNLKLSNSILKDREEVTVSVDITNTGNRVGKEVVQLYIAPKGGQVIRPIRELKEFDKVMLMPGETKTVKFQLGKRSFAYWNTIIHDWHVETGNYEIQIAKSARDVVLVSELYVESTTLIPVKYSMNSTISDIMKEPKAMSLIKDMISPVLRSHLKDDGTDIRVEADSEILTAMMQDLPLRSLPIFMPDINKEMIQSLIDSLN